MNKYELISRIEKVAPLETSEAWDCSGWLIETGRENVKKIMLCLTPTKDIIAQAMAQNCDIIISHHPMFYIPEINPCVDIYCAHTNLDKACGGTTDTLIENIFTKEMILDISVDEYLRYVNLKIPISVEDLALRMKKFSPNLRYINNYDKKQLSCIALCSGSGSEFINKAKECGADCLITGDLKFHTALDSEIVVYDMGHYESEVLVLPILEKIIDAKDCEVIMAKEKSPFIYP